MFTIFMFLCTHNNTHLCLLTHLSNMNSYETRTNGILTRIITWAYAAQFKVNFKVNKSYCFIHFLQLTLILKYK